MSLRQSRLSLIGITVALFAALATDRATAQLLPVSRTLHAEATAPPAAHNPPDLMVGPVFGPFTHSATAQGDPTSASAQAHTDMTPAQLQMRVSGSISSVFMGNIPRANASVTSLFDLAAATTFDVSLFKVGSSIHFGAGATIRGAGGGPVHYDQSAPFTMTPTPTRLTLPPGQYEARLSGAPNHAAGTGGGGTGFFEMTIIPEPTAATALAAGLLALRRRR